VKGSNGWLLRSVVACLALFIAAEAVGQVSRSHGMLVLQATQFALQPFLQVSLQAGDNHLPAEEGD
jgi:hypothetical protein